MHGVVVEGKCIYLKESELLLDEGSGKAEPEQVSRSLFLLSLSLSLSLSHTHTHTHTHTRSLALCGIFILCGRSLLFEISNHTPAKLTRLSFDKFIS
jgi:hypothetical protein